MRNYFFINFVKNRCISPLTLEADEQRSNSRYTKAGLYMWLPHVTVCIPDLTYTTTTTIVLWPFVQDYPGEPVPEEIFTHPPS